MPALSFLGRLPGENGPGKILCFRRKSRLAFYAGKLRGQTDTLYTPDYAQALALADSAIRYSPDNPRFYGLKADYYESEGHYRGALDTYLRLIRRDSSQAQYFHKIGALYDTLKTTDSSAYYYRKALERYRKALDRADLTETERQKIGQDSTETKAALDAIAPPPGPADTKGPVRVSPAH